MEARRARSSVATRSLYYLPRGAAATPKWRVVSVCAGKESENADDSHHRAHECRPSLLSSYLSGLTVARARSFYACVWVSFSSKSLWRAGVRISQNDLRLERAVVP